MIRTFSTLFFLCIAVYSSCQYSFFKEAVITKNNDQQIKGYVEKISDSYLNPEIRFKRVLEDKDFETIPVFTLKEIVFLSDSSIYERIRYDFTKDSVKTSEYRLAKKMVIGYAQLYQLQLPEEEVDIIFEQNNTYVYILLLDSSYYVLDQTERLIGKNYILDKNYQGKLFYLLRNHKDLQKEVWKLDFSHKHIVSFIDKLNKLYPDIESSVLFRKEKLSFIHGPNTGMIIVNSKERNVDYGYSIGYEVGIVSPQLSEKYSTNIGLFWNSYQATIDSKRYNYIRIPVGGTYRFNNNKVSPYLKGGLSIHFRDNLTSQEFLFNGKVGVILYKVINIHTEVDFSFNKELSPLTFYYFSIGYLF